MVQQNSDSDSKIVADQRHLQHLTLQEAQKHFQQPRPCAICGVQWKKAAARQ
jgi:hypothetical protein